MKIIYFDFSLNVSDSKITNLNPEIASNEKLDIEKFKEILIALGQKAQEYLDITCQIMGKKHIESNDLFCQSYGRNVNSPNSIDVNDLDTSAAW